MPEIAPGKQVYRLVITPHPYKYYRRTLVKVGGKQVVSQTLSALRSHDDAWRRRGREVPERTITVGVADLSDFTDVTAEWIK